LTAITAQYEIFRFTKGHPPEIMVTITHGTDALSKATPSASIEFITNLDGYRIGTPPAKLNHQPE
jgi:hypothetical protein